MTKEDSEKINNKIIVEKSTFNEKFLLSISLAENKSEKLKKEKYFLNKNQRVRNIELIESKTLNKLSFDLQDIKKLICLNSIDSLNDESLLRLFINIVKELLELHTKNIIHGNLNIDSIFMDEKQNVYFFNYINSVELNKKSDSISVSFFKNILVYEKTPEQLGRINSKIDLRSDIFSIGVIFYQLIHKKHPFKGRDDLESFHNILTKGIREVNSFSKKFDEILVRLLQKDILKRYQSVNGLLYDLELLLSTEDFQIGEKDISSKLQFPSNIYGRKKELEFLLNLFNSKKKEEKKSIFISGFSGIGKSSLIEEFRNKIGSNHYFISSKFDQYNKGLPYYAISQAFEVLTK